MHLNFTEPAGSGSGFIAFLRKHPKIRFAMRVSFFYIILMVVSVQLLSARAGHSQGLEDIKVTIELEKGDLKELFKKIENQSGLFFGYQPNQIQSIEVNIPKTTASVKEILDQAFANTSLSYKKEGYSVIVFTKETETAFQITKGVAMPVTGIVKDKNGNPMPGVSVFVKGSGNGTITDSEGRYKLDVNENDFLVFSFLGYKKVEQALNGRSTIDVIMEEDTTTLQEVQILSTNYFSTTKEKSTMNISKIDGKEINDQPVTSIMNALIGRMPGVDITPVNGNAGGAPRIEIRGINTLTQTAYPLFVIDGVQIDSRPIGSVQSYLYREGVDPLSGISPSDIESIEVLKDAGATAIYGSRGANGVIRITTKRAKQDADRSNFSFNLYTGVGRLPNKLDLLSRKEYLSMRHEAFDNAGITPDPNSSFYSDINGTWDTTRYTDWQEVLLGGTANITDVQGSFSGGNRTTSFKIGGNYHKETSILPGDISYNRGSTDFSFHHRSADQKLEISAGVNFGWTKNRTYNNAFMVSAALNLPPIAPKLYNNDGSLNWEQHQFGSFFLHTWNNPLAELEKKYESKSTSVITSGTISYEVLDGLKVRANIAHSTFENDEKSSVPIASYAPRLRPYNTGSVSFGQNGRQTLMFEPQIAYDKVVKNHSFNGIVGATYQVNRTSFSNVKGDGYSSDALLGSIKGAKTIFYITDEDNPYKYVSLYAHIGYSFKGKYLLDLTGRRDGSSRFGPDNRFGNFGAISAGWIFSDESFIKDNIRFWSFGKIRSSYGITGNDQIGDYQYLDTYEVISNGYQNGVSLLPTGLFNPDFAWEETRKFEIAIELGFIENRVAIEAAWYKNTSSNQLVNYRLSATTGFEGVTRNFDAVVQNTGLEVVVTTKNFIKDDFRWTTSFNMSVPRNKLVKFDGLEDSPYAEVYRVGEPLTLQRLYKYKGVNPETGFFEIEDIDGNGSIDFKDRVFSNPTGRSIYGGITNTLGYKNFELAFLFQLSNNPITSYGSFGMPGTASNQPTKVLDRWQKQGDNSKFQQFGPFDTETFYQVTQSNFAVSDADFIRLKTLTLSYRLEKKFIERMKLQEVRIYLQGQNLLTFSKYDGWDPETGNSSLPQLRIISAGLNVKL